jgi:4-diphosphocytidyl-2-C-methyl-D-erythritol kinase
LITRSVGPSEIEVESDLAVRAAKLLKQHTGFAGGVDIELRKQIPTGAGMGGGSSDAAGVLQGLNLLWRLGLDRTKLAGLALQLGADVPFFLHGGDQWGEGIGELLTPIELPPQHLVIVHPNVHCDTKLLYSEPQLRRDCLPLEAQSFAPETPTENVFEPIVLLRYPEVARAHAWLRLAAGNARLTGSGSALFALVPTHRRAVELKASCPPQWRAWFARTLGNSNT